MSVAAVLALLMPLASQTGALQVGEVVAQRRSLAGLVQVEGRLVGCANLWCGLADLEGRSSDYISFDVAPAFDTAVQSEIGHHVIVEGVVVANFHRIGDRNERGELLAPCMDRCPEFRPIKIVRDLDSKD